VTRKKPYLRSPKNYNEEAPDAQYTGVDYWTYNRSKLDEANTEFARRMNGEKYEDEERVR